jgi:hypothetical protein
VSTTEEWNIPAGADVCNACAEALPAGEPVTTVFRLGAGGPERADLCASCAESGGQPSDGFTWRRKQPEPLAKRAVVDYALLNELFDRMLKRTDELYRRLTYLVALVLIRKRKLRLIGFELRDGREVMVVNRGAGQPGFDVPAPFLSAEEMLPVREHLTRLLAADIEDELPELDEASRPQEGEGPDAGDEAEEEAGSEGGAENGAPVGGSGAGPGA